MKDAYNERSLKDSFISERTSTRINDKWDMCSVVDDAVEIATYLAKLVNNKRKPRKEDIAKYHITNY